MSKEKSVKLLIMILLMAFWLTPSPGLADQSLDFQKEQVRLGYSIGYLVGGDFLSQRRELDADLFLHGMTDALEGGATLLTPKQMRDTLKMLQESTTRRENAQLAAPVVKPE